MNRGLLVGLVVVLSALEMFKFQICPSEIDIDYFGNDLAFSPQNVTGADQCCLLCNQVPECQVWTFVTQTGACWLKSNVGSRRIASSGRLSGVKLAVLVSADFITSPTTTTTTLATTTITTSRATTTVTKTPATTTTTLFDPLDSTRSTTGSSSTATTTLSPTSTSSSTTTSSKADTTTVPTTSRAPTAPTQPKTSVCFIESGKNYPGDDIGGVFVIDANECCNACGRNSSCVAFSYYSSFNYCFFKGAKPNKDTAEAYTEIVSGVISSRG